MMQVWVTVRTIWSAMTKRSDADDQRIVGEVRKQFGHLSTPAKEAETVGDAAVALRSLARSTATTSPAISGQALAFLRGHRLQGVYPQEAA